MSWLDAPKSEHIIRREHFVAGVETERERIIALLDRECSCDSINPYQEKSCDACQYIALIKGENA